MMKRIKNNFTELEKRKLQKYGKPPADIQNNIDRNIHLLKTMGDSIELFTEKFIKTFIKMNG